MDGAQVTPCCSDRNPKRRTESNNQRRSRRDGISDHPFLRERKQLRTAYRTAAVRSTLKRAQETRRNPIYQKEVESGDLQKRRLGHNVLARLGRQIQGACGCRLLVGSCQASDGGRRHSHLNRQRVHRDGLIARLSTTQVDLVDCPGKGETDFPCHQEHHASSAMAEKRCPMGEDPTP